MMTLRNRHIEFHVSIHDQRPDTIHTSHSGLVASATVLESHRTKKKSAVPHEQSTVAAVRMERKNSKVIDITVQRGVGRHEDP